MNATRKPQSAFLAVTLLTVIAVTTVFMVYAAILATYTGTTVVVNETGGTIEYNLNSDNNSTWTSSIGPINNGTDWYARLNITGAATQDVTIEWILVKNNVEISNPLNSTTTLQGGVTNTFYVTSLGTYAGNYNWRQDTLTAGNYQIRAKIHTR